ncbi:MAG: DUF3667 domain-containing protein [Rhizomicrobium sp.]|jgi:hypothetical protein
MPDDKAANAGLSGAAAIEVAASALAERGHQTGTCHNCDAPTIAAYCAVCGQERDTHRRSVLNLLRDLVEDIVSFDSRILRTALALLLEPGELPKAFREGRTIRYMPALRLYFFVSLAFFLILSMTGIALMQLEVTATPTKIIRDAKGNYFIPNPASDSNDADTRLFSPLIPTTKERATRPGGLYSFSTSEHFFSRIGAYRSTLTNAQREQLMEDNSFSVKVVRLRPESPPKKEDVEKARKLEGAIKKGVYDGMSRIASDPAALNGPLTTWIPRILFLLLPLYALLLATFYWRQRKTFYFVDHLIFSLSVHTFLFVVLIVDIGLAQIVPADIVAWLTLIAVGVYIFIAMKRFYEQGWVWTTIKFGAVSFIYSVFFLAPALAGAIALSFFGGSFG